jgi:hypothetical protein
MVSPDEQLSSSYRAAIEQLSGYEPHDDDQDHQGDQRQGHP